MATINYRTASVDIYDPDSPLNFPLPTLQPASLPPPTTAAAAATTATHIRQLLRSGDSAAALSAVLDSAPLAGDDAAKQVHLATVIEVLQGIRQSDVAKILEGVLGSNNNAHGQGQGGGAKERGDTLMKYLYRGMGAPGGKSAGAGGVSPQMTGASTGPGGGFSQIQARNLGEAGAGSGGGQAMSVLLSWHEKLVEIVGVGGIVRVMCDRRTV